MIGRLLCLIGFHDWLDEEIRPNYFHYRCMRGCGAANWMDIEDED